MSMGRPTDRELAAHAVVRLLQFAGDNPGREGLRDTPDRVVKAFGEWFSGYNAESDADILKGFEDGATGYDEMVLVKDIPLYSKCEHHLADIFGTVSIAYIPNADKPVVVGLSKLARLAEKYARRLQVQERLTIQIADALRDTLNPVGVAVCVRARHMCMESRGISKQGHYTVTTALRGAFKDKPETRAEFMSWAAK